MGRFLNKLIFILVIEAALAECCIKHERQALLEFKASVNDPSNRLDSWTGDECCNWEGIRCNNQTSHVVRLNLNNPTNPYSYYDYDLQMKHSLSGEVSPSLLALSKLKYLDLSYNNFTRIPEFIGSFKTLTYLNLSNAYFSGKLPPQLGNLSQLQFLDLSNFQSSSAVANIWWISHLTSLKHLDMSGVSLKNLTEWVQPLNKLPLLEVLVFDYNSLTHIPDSVPLLNFTSLRVLQLSDQTFGTAIPSWIFRLLSLTNLNLAISNFVGQLPNDLGNLTSLIKLEVDSNPLYGKIPPLYNLTKLTFLSLASTSIGEGNITQISSSFTHETWMRMEGLILRNTSLIGNLNGWVGAMSNLQYLYLGNNYLTGPIPDEIGNLKNLVELDLSYNYFTGSLTEVHLGRLSQLESLGLDNNSITIAVETNWQPSFQLHELSIYSCQLLKFPAWVENQVEIEMLFLPSSGIDDVLPDWLWSLASLTDLDLSENKIRGKLPKSLKNMTQLNNLYLNDNHLEGIVPSSYPEFLLELYLHNNRFEQLPGMFEAPNLTYLSLENNSISGRVESTFCTVTKLISLDLSSNNLYGNIPNCSLNNLLLLDLAKNKLSGTIPGTLCYSGSLSVLQLNSNNFTGEFPSYLRYCEKLTLLDIGNNKFHGEIPEWVWENLASLEFLRLRSNIFSGSISLKLTMLDHLQFLDLSNNYFSGRIPTHLDNLTAMVALSHSEVYDYEDLPATVKGIDLTYNTNSLEYLISIDLSNNNLRGTIPDTIAALVGLMNLNLSNNHLIGKIPTEIGDMKSLESLDLRMNDLSGSIPQSMSTLNSLAVLNLSYNNLSGPIPRGYQLQTLDNSSIYMGNPYLCGPPLKMSCYSISSPSNNNEGHFDDREKLWFYLFLEFGFVAGLLGLILFLLFKTSWRYAYFHMVDKLFDMIYVLGALTLKTLREQTWKLTKRFV